jgi:hypothetical protein
MITQVSAEGSGLNIRIGSTRSPRISYFNHGELTELFSIVRGRTQFCSLKRGLAPLTSSGHVSPAHPAEMERISKHPEHVCLLSRIRTRTYDANLTLEPSSLRGSSENGIPTNFHKSICQDRSEGSPTRMYRCQNMDAFCSEFGTSKDESFRPSLAEDTMSRQRIKGNIEGSCGKRDDDFLSKRTVHTGTNVGKSSRNINCAQKKLSIAHAACPLTGNGANLCAAGAAASACLNLPSVPSVGSVQKSANDVNQLVAPSDNIPATNIDEFGRELLEGHATAGCSNSRSRSWLASEDELVRTLVAQFGPRKWKLIASRLKTKSQKQVYARWRDYLQPGLTTQPWSKEEQVKLLELQEHVGNQWAVLARLMPGRSPNAIKNRYHATKRKLERHNMKYRESAAMTLNNTTDIKGDAPSEPAKTLSSARGGTTAVLTESQREFDVNDDEALAVEGLLLAETPTAMSLAHEKEEADRLFEPAGALFEGVTTQK